MDSSTGVHWPFLPSSVDWERCGGVCFCQKEGHLPACSHHLSCVGASSPGNEIVVSRAGLATRIFNR